jgi:hypothetical protein
MSIPDTKKKTGIKIVTENPNFRTTDIFNTKPNTERQQLGDKEKLIKVSEQMIDNKMRV